MFGQFVIGMESFRWYKWVVPVGLCFSSPVAWGVLLMSGVFGSGGGSGVVRVDIVRFSLGYG